jgi:hypothetical protein
MRRIRPQDADLGRRLMIDHFLTKRAMKNGGIDVKQGQATLSLNYFELTSEIGELACRASM